MKGMNLSCLANVSTDLEIRYPDSRKRIETVYPETYSGF